MADLGHVQGATLIITDNECCEGIFNGRMQLCSHTDASYLSVSKARSCAAAYFYIFTDNGALLPPDNNSKLSARPNGAVHVMSTVMRQVLSPATEAEVGATFYSCQDAVPLRNTVADLGHVQGATLIITDNECCEGIFNNTVKKKRSKAMDIQFYWENIGLHRDNSNYCGDLVKKTSQINSQNFTPKCITKLHDRFL